MVERDIDKLLGGYATGTLTDEERRRLFETALHDQALFDALTREDALKEVLDDPTHRRRLLAALEAQQRSARRPLGALLEWFRRPANLALAGTWAAAVIAVWVFVALEREPAVTPPDGDRVAQVEQSAQQPEPRPEPSKATDALEASKPPAPSQPTQPRVRAKTADPERSVSPAARKKTVPRASASAEAPASPDVSSFRVLPKKKESRAASSVAPLAVSAQGRPRWLTSYRRPVEPGPARHLYYARLAPAPMWEGAVRPEPKEQASAPVPQRPQSKAREEAAKAEAPRLGVGAELGGEAGAPKPLGLRYSVIKQGKDGDFAETNPDGPFRADDAMRVTVEVNETGYLYVFRLGPSGEWLWTSSSGPLGKEKRESGVGVLSGNRYVIPGTGGLPLYAQPSANKMILIYSRQPRQELQVFHPAVLERQDGDDRPAADLETLLSRARIETSTRPLLVEQVRADKPEGSQERAVYIVNPEAGRDAAIAIELTFPAG